MEQHTAEVWVKTLGILGIILGALGIIFGIMTILGGGIFSMVSGIASGATEGGPAVSGLLGIFAAYMYLFGILIFLVSIFYIVASVNLMKYKPWAKISTIVVAVLALLLGIVMFPFGILGILANILIIVVMLLPEPSALFQGAAVQQTAPTTK